MKRVAVRLGMASASRRLPGWRGVAPLVAVVVVGSAWQAGGEPVAGQTPPTTAPNLVQDLLNALFPTTTAPAPAPGPAPAPAPGQPGAPPTTAAPSAGAPLVGPPEGDPKGPPVQLQPDSIRRSGGRTTDPLLELLRGLEVVGFSREEAIAVGMGRFPVGGLASYGDDYLEPRPGHLHQGVDILAVGGTPIRASSDGVVSFSEQGGYGKVAALTAEDGTTYFSAHLERFPEGMASGTAVKLGQTIGYIGATGNATATHNHFEVRPPGGGTTNPKPLLDQWLNEAEAAVPGILASFKALEVTLPRALIATGLLRRFDERPTGAATALSALSWASSVDAGAGVLPRAERRAVELASAGETQQPVQQPASTDAWYEAERLSRAVVSPLTPSALDGVLSGEPD